jgi:hypothetical protein
LIRLPMNSTTMFARAVDAALKSGPDQFQRRIIPISAPNGSLNETLGDVRKASRSFDDGSQ